MYDARHLLVFMSVDASLALLLAVVQDTLIYTPKNI